MILASASPRRAELLRAAGIEFDAIPANVDETVQPGEAPEAYVVRVAEQKAAALVPHAGDRPVLAADTAVVVDGHILGKPADAGAASRMLRLLAGRRHDVMTGVVLCYPADGSGTSVTRLAVTRVEFAPMTDDEIDWYVATGEPADKAGAYAIQGYASRFVTRIDGSYSNVVGLPIALVCDLLRSMEAGQVPR